MHIYATILQLLLLIVMATTGCASRGRQQAPGSSGPPSILKIVSTELKRPNHDAFTHEIFLDHHRFGSLRALKRHLARSGRPERIEYDHSCLGIADRPLAQYDELEAFQRFCANHGIVLDLVHGVHAGRLVRMPQTTDDIAQR